MGSRQPTPRIRKTSQNIQLTYNLPHRIHDVKTYPVLSPQGATILLYAHENGVRILWRGGKRFKPTKKPTAPPQDQKNGSADIIMLDSDDDEPPPKPKAPAPFVDKPEFEGDAADGPYPDIVQTLDLSLGAPAHHLAVPQLTPCSPEDVGGPGADLLQGRMVFAVSCTTADVYLISLPLSPPSPESKARPDLRSNLFTANAGPGAWGEAVTLLTGQTKQSNGIALTFAKPEKDSIASDRVQEHAGSSDSEAQPHLIVASHNREATGVLRLWDVRLNAKTGKADSGRVKPFQTELLPSPLTGISFNPANLSQLLVVASIHPVRIYDYALPCLPPDDQATGPFPSKGSWLLSLYQPFVRPTGTRKPILDAAWIAHGRAIFVLMADGTWGIWDVEGASPLGATILGKQSSGVEGAALTKFSVTGHVEGTSPLRGTNVGSKPGGDFVPMTPHTRRDAAASLSAVTAPERLASVRGGIVVTPLPAISSGSGSGDESVVLWIGGLDNVSVIPAVYRFWDAQLRRSAGGGVNLFSGTVPTRMIRLQDLSTGLLGEHCCGVGAAVNFAKLQENDGGLRVEVLVQGETRLVIVREAEEGGGTKAAGIVSTRRRLFSDRRGAPAEAPSAIIVHPRPDKPRNVSFNLSVSKRRSVRGLRPGGQGDTDRASDTHEEGDQTHDFTLPIGRPRSAFGFADLDAAADAQDDVEGRDIEAEMLDIMEIDRALDSMEDHRGSGRKKVLFEES
ncbi:hypothetical protein ACRALDRAFT_1058857 [Sodiomyces alcalophilus JCM 7366]|uniref:uncharacterized protein n=1 Tax=Sodiomyces alcalophilus JCM 7366 TaxID=591952 RepID=UPI0039B6B329